MFGESYADKLRTRTLADNTVGRRISDISEDLCDQLIEKLKQFYSALQVDEATDVIKDAHLITYVRYVVETDVKEDMLFCKPSEGNTTASEIFNMMIISLKKMAFCGRTVLGYAQMELHLWQKKTLVYKH